MRRLLGAIALISWLQPAHAMVILNASWIGRRYDGFGGLSGGGATSRLLPDYGDPFRSQILDLLFKPFFGASLHLLKTEVGGDTFSGCGTEPSHMHNASDLNFERGYEWWLMGEAAERNPSIQHYMLPWGFPGWIGANNSGQPLNQEQAAYMTAFCENALAVMPGGCAYTGIWNEQSWSADYVLELRAQLNAAGFNATRIIVADGGWDPAPTILANSSFADAVYAIGVHYPQGSNSTPQAIATGKPLWSSEDSSTYFDAAGGLCLARIQNWNYLFGNMSSIVIWNLISSYYDHLFWYGDSLMGASYPWSGSYQVASPIWMAAHWTQFAWPGWHFLPSSIDMPTGSGGAGMLPGGGTYVTLVDATMFSNNLDELIDASSLEECRWRVPSAGSATTAACIRRLHEKHFASQQAFSDFGASRSAVPAENLHWSILLETTTTAHSQCIRSNPAHAWQIADAQNVTFVLDSTLALPPSGSVVAWKSVLFTSANEPSIIWFERIDDITVNVQARSFTVNNLHPDTVLTLTSMDRGQQHGSFDSPPPNTPFPRQYEDQFSNYTVESMPKYFSDHAGSWAIMPRRDGVPGSAFEQVVTELPVAWHDGDDSLYPLTLLGDWNTSYADVSVASYIYSRSSINPGTGPLVSLASCNETDASQVWQWNVSDALPGSLSDSLLNHCFDVYGCNASAGVPIWMWPCVDTPGNCGSLNQLWTYDEVNSLMVSRLNGYCLTAVNGSIMMQPCGSGMQQWEFDAFTGLFFANTTPATCLSSLPPAGDSTHVGLGVRLGGMTNSSSVAAAYASTWYNFGYWFSVRLDGSWVLYRGNMPAEDRAQPEKRSRHRVARHSYSLKGVSDPDSRVTLAAGSLPAGTMGLAQWHTLRLVANASTIAAYFDGRELARVQDSSYSVGWSALSSGWHISQFSNFSMFSSQ